MAAFQTRTYHQIRLIYVVSSIVSLKIFQCYQVLLPLNNSLGLLTVTCLNNCSLVRHFAALTLIFVFFD